MRSDRSNRSGRHENVVSVPVGNERSPCVNRVMPCCARSVRPGYSLAKASASSAGRRVYDDTSNVLEFSVDKLAEYQVGFNKQDQRVCRHSASNQ